MKQRRFLEEKLSHNPKPTVVAACVTSVIVGCGALLLSMPWWVILGAVLLPVLSASRSFNELQLLKVRRTALDNCVWQLEAGLKIEVEVDAIEVWRFREEEDEGAAFLFRCDAEEWFFLQGQDFAPAQSWPCLHFILKLDASELLLELVPLAEKASVSGILDSAHRESFPPAHQIYAILETQETEVLRSLAAASRRGRV